MDDLYHKREYDVIRESYPDLPEWDSLTEDQKAKIRVANLEKQSYFNKLGNAIANGSELPKYGD